MARDNSAMMLVGLAAIGGAAMLYARKSHAATTETKDPDKDPNTDKDKIPQEDLPDVLPDGPHATIGNPYIEGDANLGKNVAIAVATRPSIHPTGMSRAKTSWDNWLANVVYWETWPTAPLVVPSTQHPSAALWTLAHNLVVQALTPSKDPKKDKDKTPVGHATIGEPFRAGEAEHNAEQAVKIKPKAHPAGGAQKPGQNLNDWLTNIAYWESYPLAPVKLSSPKGIEADNWRAIAAMIAKLLKTPKTETDKKKDDGLYPSLGAPYRPGSDQERANALLAVKFQPVTHPRGETQGKTPLADWLANVAFWETWPVAKTKLESSKGGLADSWRRIRAHVGSALAVKTTPKTTPTTKQTTPTTTPTKKTTPKTTTPTEKTTPKTTTPTKKTTPKTETIPAQPGWYAGDIASNVSKAVDERPLSYANRTRDPKTAIENWFANVAYWATWPDAPIKIERGDKQNIARWNDAKARVVAAIKAKAKSTPNKTTPKQTTPKTTPTQTPAQTWAPGDLEGNARLASKDRPQSFNGRSPKKGQKQRDWLANVVYWATWPDAPIEIKKGDKQSADLWLQAQHKLGDFGVAGESRLDAANEIRNAALAISGTQSGPEFVRRAATTAMHKSYPRATQDAFHDLAGRRILQYIQRGAALARKLGPPPENWPMPDGKGWLPWAVVMANASGLRRPEEIATGAKMAADFLANNPQVRGDGDVGPILAETAHAIIVGKPLHNLDITQYPDTLAYMAASELL